MADLGDGVLSAERQARIRQQIAEAREKYPHGAKYIGWWVPLTLRDVEASLVYRSEDLPLDSDEPCPGECGGIPDLRDNTDRCPSCDGTGKADSIIQRIKTGRWSPE